MPTYAQNHVPETARPDLDGQSQGGDPCRLIWVNTWATFNEDDLFTFLVLPGYICWDVYEVT
jgi:hypothetical protein